MRYHPPAVTALHRLGRALGAGKVRLAQEVERAGIFVDCELGALPPFGSLYGLEVYARPAGQVMLTRGRQSETVRIEEIVDPQEAGPILKRYVRLEPITRSFFGPLPDAPAGAFAAEADRHPVFRVLGPTTGLHPTPE